MATCFKCMSKIDAWARVCPYCTRDVYSISSSSGGSSAQSEGIFSLVILIIIVGMAIFK
jgi:predicted amidophosphoribosyltransferase